MIASGVIFGLLAVVHVWRMIVERSVLHEPSFIGTTVFAVAMCAWAWSVATRAGPR